MLDSVDIVDDRAAVVPQPDDAALFVARSAEEGMGKGDENGAASSVPSSEDMNGQKRQECGRVAAAPPPGAETGISECAATP